MKINPFLPSILTALLATACATSPTPLNLLGDPAPPSAATRTIVITPSTRYVNVTGGETIAFLVGDKAFGWSFNGIQNTPAFDLSRAAPAGVLDHKVLAYVAPNPLYMDDASWGRHSGGHR